MSILQAACIALAVVLSCVAYVALSLKASDFVTDRFGSMDLGAAVFVVMIATPHLTAFILVLIKDGVWP